MDTKELLKLEYDLIKKSMANENARAYIATMKDRTDAQIDRDVRFLQAFDDAKHGSPEPPQLALSLQLHPGGHVQAWDGDRFYSINLPEGLYDKDALKKAIKDETPCEKAIYDGLLYSLYQELLGKSGLPSLSIMLTENGQYVSIENPPTFANNEIPLHYGGLAYKVVDGKLTLQRALTTAEFEKFYPKIATHGQPNGYYYSALLAKETAPMWDQAPAVLEEFRSRCKLYPTVDILAAVPVWIRTWGMSQDANGITKRDFYRKIAHPYKVSTLLRDEMAWRIHFKLAGKIVEGVAHFNGPENNCRLVISDWCYRETPEGAAEMEMYHGHHNQLDILTWLAGPATDRFLGQTNSKFKLKPIARARDYTKFNQAMWDAMLVGIDTATPVNTAAELNTILEQNGNVGSIMQGTTLFHIVGPVKDNGLALLHNYCARGQHVSSYKQTMTLNFPVVIVPEVMAGMVWGDVKIPQTKPVVTVPKEAS